MAVPIAGKCGWCRKPIQIDWSNHKKAVERAQERGDLEPPKFFCSKQHSGLARRTGVAFDSEVEGDDLAILINNKSADMLERKKVMNDRFNQIVGAFGWKQFKNGYEYVGRER